MKRNYRRLAFSLALMLAIPNTLVGMPVKNNIAVVQAAENDVFAEVDSVDMEELMAQAELSKVFAEGDQEFDGTRAVDMSEAAAEVHQVNTGSIILRFQAEGSSDKEVLLGLKDASIALPEGLETPTGTSCASFLLMNDSEIFRFIYSHTKAALGGPNSFKDGNWHTIVLSSMPSGKYMRLTIDGQEVWSNTVASNKGLFSTMAKLDQITIGAQKNPDGSTAYGFNGAISHVIITSQELTDAQAKEISEAGCSIPKAPEGLGTALEEMFTDLDESDVSNSWVVAGGETAQGGFESARGTRNFVGHFEEYIRWKLKTNNGTIPERQRYVVNVSKKGQTLTDVAENYESLIAKFDPRGAIYMVDKEDYSQGEDALEGFKADLKAFIDQSLRLRNDDGFAVILKPVASKDVQINAVLEAYCEAVDAVVEEYSSDLEKYSHIAVVDHYTATNTDDFKMNKMQADGSLNVLGHYEVGRQMVYGICGQRSDYDTNIALNKTEEKMPSEYPDVMPQVTAGADFLEAVIPDEVTDQYGNEWKYEVTVEGMTISGETASGHFTIEGLPADCAYVLKLQSADGTAQLTTMMGVIKEGNQAVKNAQVLDANQQKIAELVAGEASVTWLFMGDSITHACHHTRGYDGVAQLVEKFVKDELGRTDDVIVNTGVSSADTATTLENIVYRLDNYKPDIMSIMLGTNDPIFDIDPEEYADNLQLIVDRAKEINPEVVILLRTPAATWQNQRVGRLEAYNAAMKQVAEENDLIFIDQYTNGQEALDTYSWLKNGNYSQYLFNDPLHPGANGQILMARQFLKAAGIWTEDSAITNLFYEMPFNTVSKNEEPEIAQGRDAIALSKENLEAAAGTELGHVIITAEAEENAQSYEITVKDGEEPVLRNLPTDASYTVKTTAYAAAANNRIEFAPVQIDLSSSTEAKVTFGLSSEKAEELGAGTVIGKFAVNGLTPSGVYTFTLCDGDGSADNESFMIEDGKLMIRKALVKGTTYSIRVKADNGSYVSEEIFEIYAAGIRKEIPVDVMKATAGSSETSQASEGPEKALDGNNGTLWHSAYSYSGVMEDLWYQLELDEVYLVDGFRYQPRTSGTNGLITKYEIYTSVDGAVWTKAAEGSWASDASLKDVEFEAVEAKYVKLVPLAAGSTTSTKFASAAEIRLTGVLADETACEHLKTELTGTKEATEEEEGYTGDLVCQDCGVMLEKGTVISKLEKPAPINPFVDVTEADYFYNSVLWAVENNVTAGITPTTFEPYTECNRAQIVLFLYRALKGEAADTENPFVDVSEADYCYDAVLWAVENGITTGITETTFEPWKACSRAEIVTFLWRAMGAKEVTTDKTFPDVNAADFFYDAVAWAVENGVTQGRNDGTFGAWYSCWRADAVTFIQRAAEK